MIGIGSEFPDVTCSALRPKELWDVVKTYWCSNKGSRKLWKRAGNRAEMREIKGLESVR